MCVHARVRARVSHGHSESKQEIHSRQEVTSQCDSLTCGMVDTEIFSCEFQVNLTLC